MIDELELDDHIEDMGSFYTGAALVPRMAASAESAWWCWTPGIPRDTVFFLRWEPAQYMISMGATNCEVDPSV